MEKAFTRAEKETGVPADKQIRQALLAYLEDLLDARLARRALADVKRNGTVPLAEIKKRFGP